MKSLLRVAWLGWALASLACQGPGPDGQPASGAEADASTPPASTQAQAPAETPPSAAPHNPAYEAALHACEQSLGCAEKGECGGSAHQRCYVRNDDDCRASAACKVWGRCRFDADFSSACVASEAKDCLAAEVCVREGRCTLRRGACVRDEAACARWPGCAERGRCAWSSKVEAGTDEIRRASDVCREGALDCELACAERGACSLDETKKACVATSEGECRASRDCTREGMCSLDAEAGACVAATNDDCRASEMCSREKRCNRFPNGDICIPARSACDASCALDGRCERVEGSCHPTRAEHCSQSKACEVQGRCGFALARANDSIGTCTASPEHCASSLECKAFGRCSSDGLRCTNPDEKPASSYAMFACLKDPGCARLGRCLRTPEDECVTADEAGRVSE